MSVPKSRKSSSSVRRRRSHLHLNPVNIGTCEKCKAPSISHQVCGECGFYKGRQTVDNSRNTERALAKQQPKHDHTHEEPATAPVDEKKTEE
ncbi:MAG: 50S ribosomal protein L32 [Parcubacteria group bacterium]|nr:50S ribosomal protein L32 [Parcubacteria group bacterium]